MRKALLIYLTVIFYLWVIGPFWKMFNPLFNLITKYVESNLSASANVVTNILPQLFYFIIFYLLNQMIFKQKVLFEHYSIIKILLLWSPILFLIYPLFFQGQWLWGAEDFILTNFIYAMLIAICEEYIFRGMILGTLVSKKVPLLVSLLVSSLLFSLLHFENLTNNSLLNVSFQVLYTFPMGFFLAVLYVKSGNLWTSILAHAFIDFYGFCMSGGSTISTVTSIKLIAFQFIIYSLPALLFLFFGKKQRRRFVKNLEYREDKITLSRPV
ncbi:CPBP family intramembrane glutamic endopeptidase [Lactococcus fujiensis]|uniref:CAAX prenyl protease 2/Lysostaphin resistance protein A-like domain-containing protein n=2 Tax=Lactococcus fujiensis TaxID=610251 RepID=A0A2A5RMA0_9LACT|nr:CPBP family intramembrane glutamic endopeptidase [Lactococcus fujiensis]PCS00406.1 hypothetical protein RT41_GL001293 [Lactococcus fujiensis JCM 16395]